MDLGLDKLQVHLDKLARLPKGARMAAVPALMVLVLGVYGYLFFMPARQELAKAEQERLQLQRKLSEVRAVAANEQAVRDEIAMLEKKLAVALRQLPGQQGAAGAAHRRDQPRQERGPRLPRVPAAAGDPQGLLRRGADRHRVHAAASTTSPRSSIRSRGCRGSSTSPTSR